MSGSLSTFGLSSSAGLLSQIPGVGGVLGNELSKLLSAAALGGVTFDCLDSREAAGRRVQRFLFPERSVDEQLFQDFGNLDAPMHLTGIIGGDDYVIRATRMMKVLQKKGPQTLVHPWWGRLRVRIITPGEIAFSSTQMRLAHFTVSVVREPAKGSSTGLLARITDTIGHVLEAADGLVDEATLAVQGVLSVLSVPLALAGGVSSFLSQAEGVWDGVLGNAPQPIQSATASGMAVLAAGVSAPAVNTGTDYANAVVAAFAAVPVAVANAVTDPDDSIVAPAQTVMGDVTDTVDASVAGDLLLAAAVKIGAAADDLSTINSMPQAVLALGVAARAIVVSQLLSCWCGLNFNSDQDALAARDRYVAALDAVIVDIEDAASSGSSVSLSGLWSRTQAARLAVMADASAQIGRLPSVVTVDLAAPVPGWVLAYAVAGDDVTRVQPVLDDLITRNTITHPAQVGPGLIGVLEQ